jgi:hypothetical protein
MIVEILKNAIRLPAQNNLTWVFPVRLDDREPIDWNVDSFDLNLWFKEVVGRYPHNEKGDQEEREDILANWSRVEPRLRAEAEREAQLGMKIGVDGMQASASERSKAQLIPKEELPPLNGPQRTAARRLGYSEEEYARMLVAEQRTTRLLFAKIEMFARFLAKKLQHMDSRATIESVILKNLKNRFDVELKLDGNVIPVSINKDLVDDLFESGSVEAEQRLQRILEITVGAQERR